MQLACKNWCFLLGFRIIKMITDSPSSAESPKTLKFRCQNYVEYLKWNLFQEAFFSPIEYPYIQLINNFLIFSRAFLKKKK